MNKRKWIAGGAPAAVFVLSLALFLAFPQDAQRRLLIFPDTAGGERHREWHRIPRRRDRRDQVEMFVRELTLGPVQLGAVPFIPEEAEIRSLVLRDDTLYIDFSEDVMFDENRVELGFGDLEQLLQENLRHNFRWLERAVILIDGQEPDAPRFG